MRSPEEGRSLGSWWGDTHVSEVVVAADLQAFLIREVQEADEDIREGNVRQPDVRGQLRGKQLQHGGNRHLFNIGTRSKLVLQHGPKSRLEAFNVDLLGHLGVADFDLLHARRCLHELQRSCGRRRGHPVGGRRCKAFGAIHSAAPAVAVVLKSACTRVALLVVEGTAFSFVRVAHEGSWRESFVRLARGPQHTAAADTAHTRRWLVEELGEHLDAAATVFGKGDVRGAGLCQRGVRQDGALGVHLARQHGSGRLSAPAEIDHERLLRALAARALGRLGRRRLCGRAELPVRRARPPVPNLQKPLRLLMQRLSPARLGQLGVHVRTRCTLASLEKLID
mmetsp:Transcript_44772/g.95256  ORF Transcript_44772/g.95256 Transcript_44772/m.95256 type:complete len:338 (+) Transcript_44772:269-1282(+)